MLVAEVMSQQTGIERVGPAWRRFVDRWPTPADLAAAGTHELLAAWAGLGYNRRALALRECARKIVADHGGRVPADGRGARVAARDRSLHGPSRRGLGLRRAGRTARCERPARRLAVAGRAVIIVGPSGCGGRPGLARSAWSLARRRHGSRLSDVHASRAAHARPVRSRPCVRREASWSQSSRKPQPYRSR